MWLESTENINKVNLACVDPGISTIFIFMHHIGNRALMVCGLHFMFYLYPLKLEKSGKTIW